MIDNLESVTPTLFSNPMITNLCENNAIIEREMMQHLDHLAAQMRGLNIKERKPEDPCGEDATPEGDVIFPLIADIRKGEHNPEILFQNAQTSVTAMSMMKGDCVGFEGYNYLYDNPSRIRKLVEIAIEEENRRKFKSLSAEKSYISMSVKSLELFDTTNQINLYKQNFIQIMAYFDSCIFDMVRLCMKEKFFQWLSFFDNVNIKTHDIAASSNFDSFKDAQTEASLKKCYIKDLLNILHSNFSGIFTINGTDVYPVLQEMIGRRNVHIHHNGIVDEMYLTKFNIYGVVSGAYLEITKNYFDNAVELTKQIVTSIATTCI